jgi:Ca2+/H+ antiporter, TMEM165/GDT1 family
MEILTSSFFLVFFSEMGDKTQLLAILLVAKFHRPWTILFGVFLATILNHALAAYFGQLAASYISEDLLRWILAALFFGFAIWILFPDKEENLQKPKYGALLTTLVTFFLAEMGDKTQMATIALGAHYPSAFWVTLGSTMGMMASNAIAIFLGKRFLKKIPLKWVFRFSSFLFFAFGLGILLKIGF